ncbi:hypothetical protein AB205_0086810 [Aquarana catesbeiana]|uniref:Uncharacterized protein n=1 Tax=Aquarana catesbeiana TaxID=8400 RepID=A0A2G9RBY0_AQUCT|nr:hypothetical protein AB205_0086810 [Aquarana catesbeiana]
MILSHSQPSLFFFPHLKTTNFLQNKASPPGLTGCGDQQAEQSRARTTEQPKKKFKDVRRTQCKVRCIEWNLSETHDTHTGVHKQKPPASLMAHCAHNSTEHGCRSN